MRPIQSVGMLAAAFAAAGLLAGCYAVRPSEGAGEGHLAAERVTRPQDVALPAGYRLEAVATVSTSRPASPSTGRALAVRNA
jgi:hypothetical protein